jgi:hypothetical protein
MQVEGGGYRRDHVRALAQRIEVDAKEVRSTGTRPTRTTHNRRSFA